MGIKCAISAKFGLRKKSPWGVGDWVIKVRSAIKGGKGCRKHIRKRVIIQMGDGIIGRPSRAGEVRVWVEGGI